MGVSLGSRAYGPYRPNRTERLGEFYKAPVRENESLWRALPVTGLWQQERKLIKIGAKGVTTARYVIFQMAEVAIPRRLFQAILERIRRLKVPSVVPG